MMKIPHGLCVHPDGQYLLDLVDLASCCQPPFKMVNSSTLCRLTSLFFVLGVVTFHSWTASASPAIGDSSRYRYQPIPKTPTIYSVTEIDQIKIGTKGGKTWWSKIKE